MKYLKCTPEQKAMLDEIVRQNHSDIRMKKIGKISETICYILALVCLIAIFIK